MILNKDEYYNLRGINLNKELGMQDHSNYADIWLEEQEEWLKYYISFEFDDYIETPETNKALKKALICQIDYLLLHGDISKTNGLDKALAPNAYMILKQNGMANNSTITKSRGRFYARY